MPCTLVRLVQFSKVFVALTTTILVYHSHFSLSTGFFNFFKSYFHQPRYTHSPYGIRTRVTAVKRRCLNPLTNGPELFQLFLLYLLFLPCQEVEINFSYFLFFTKKKAHCCRLSVRYFLKLKHLVVEFNDKCFVDFWVDFITFWQTSQ